MKNTITKPNKPALFTSGKDVKPSFTQEPPAIYKKLNFFVDINGEFKVFSYEAHYDGEFVNIKVKDASRNRAYLNLSPSFTKICKIAIEKRYGTINVAEKTLKVEYEEFCEALFKYICDAIADGQGE